MPDGETEVGAAIAPPLNKGEGWFRRASRLAGKLRRTLEHQIRVRAARARRKNSRAVFIGITGSSGKSTTASLLVHILEAHGQTDSALVYNDLRALLRLLRRLRRSSAYVVAEAGISGKGQMQPRAALLQPHVAVVTMINNEHYTAFRGREEVATEKAALVEAVQPGGFVVLNAEDAHVMTMARLTKERIVTIGRTTPADFNVSVHPLAGEEGLLFEVQGAKASLRLHTRFIAEHFWLPCAAAAVTALELGVPAELIVQRVASFPGLAERFQLISPKNGPRFVLDTVKAPLDTLPFAFDAFGKMKAKRKRIVLGQISDYAGNPKPKYRAAYETAAKVADQVIFVGQNAHRSGAKDDDRQSGRFLAFRGVKEVSDYLHLTATPDDLILLKSSRNLHLERVALAWEAEVNCWADDCGIKDSCMNCGLYAHPFAEHSELRRARKRDERSKRWARRLSGGKAPAAT